MKKSSLFVIAGIVLLTLGGGAFFLWRRRGAEVSAPKEEPRSERQFPVAPPSAEETSYEKFTSGDGHFSFEYPTEWTRTQIENLETVLPQEFINRYNLEMPLILSSPQGAQITLSTYLFAEDKNLNAVMDELEAALIELGQPYDEVDRQMVGDSLVVDSEVAAQGVTVKVRDILFLAPGEAGVEGNTIYNLAFSAPASRWGEYQAIFDHVQNSTKLSL